MKFRRLLSGAALALVCALSTGLTAPAQASEPVPVLSLPYHPRTLIMGDSYSVGVGDEVSYNGLGWVPKAQRDLNWSVTRDAWGGSGYCNPTTYGAGVYSDRLASKRYAYDSFDLIVLQGSSNDHAYSEYQLAVCINRALHSAQRHFPHAKILMVGATNPYGNFPSDSYYWKINRKLEAAALSYRLPFIHPLKEHWFVPGDGSRYAQNYGSGKGHPNNAGYNDVYATRFVSDVRRLTS